MKVGDKVCLSTDYYGEGAVVTGVLVKKALPNVVWGSEPRAPELWYVKTKSGVIRVWDYLMEIDNG